MILFECTPLQSVTTNIEYTRCLATSDSLGFNYVLISVVLKSCLP